MSRSRKADPSEALMAATQLFWREGYGAVGTRQVEDETGITRFTLQTTYGGKMALFLATLDFYLDMFESGAPNAEAKSLDELARWFEGFAKPSTMADISCFGCLMLNTVAEFGATDPEVTVRATRYFTLMRSRISAALNGLIAQGKVVNTLDVTGQVEILLGCVIGMNIVVRSAGASAAVTDMAEATGALIRSWAVAD